MEEAHGIRPRWYSFILKLDEWLIPVVFLSSRVWIALDNLKIR